MSTLAGKPKEELSEADLARLEDYESQNGPLSVLQKAVDEGTPVLVSLRSNKKLWGRVKAYDRHANMVLVNVKEMWTERPVSSTGKKGKPVAKDRFISSMFLRGDGVVLVVAA